MFKNDNGVYFYGERLFFSLGKFTCYWNLTSILVTKIEESFKFIFRILCIFYGKYKMKETYPIKMQNTGKVSDASNLSSFYMQGKQKSSRKLIFKTSNNYKLIFVIDRWNWIYSVKKGELLLLSVFTMSETAEWKWDDLFSF